MPEEIKNKTEEVQFPLNKQLFEESAKIKEERKVIKERLQKIEASKADVSNNVYEKVKSDYLEKLQVNTDKLLEKKSDIDKELSSLFEAKKKVEENVKTHKAALEEINFRNNLGEYKKEAFNKKAKEENEKLSKFEKILAAINSNISQYESLFEGEEEFDYIHEESPKEETAPPPPPPTSAEPQTDPVIEENEDYESLDEKNYFSEEAISPKDEYETEPEFQTSKDIPLEEQTAEEALMDVSKALAKLEIIDGDELGKIFDIKKDEITIGRASSNEVVLKEAKVSRQHATIKRHGNEYLIEDLQSSNGIFVNEEKVKEHALSDGDIVQIGDFVMKFSI